MLFQHVVFAMNDEISKSKTEKIGINEAFYISTCRHMLHHVVAWGQKMKMTRMARKVGPPRHLCSGFRTNLASIPNGAGPISIWWSCLFFFF